jgi:hypothetical protein
MYERSIHIHLSGIASENTTDAEIADLRDILVELMSRFPGVQVTGYSASGWVHDGTALDGEAPTADNVAPPHIGIMLMDLALGTVAHE